jgi:hypothetical protein
MNAVHPQGENLKLFQISMIAPHEMAAQQKHGDTVKRLSGDMDIPHFYSDLLPDLWLPVTDQLVNIHYSLISISFPIKNTHFCTTIVKKGVFYR